MLWACALSNNYYSGHIWWNWDANQLVDSWVQCAADTGLIPWLSKGFFSHYHFQHRLSDRFPGAARDFSPILKFSVQILVWCWYSLSHVQLHALTSVHMLKIPSISSNTITQNNDSFFYRIETMWKDADLIPEFLNLRLPVAYASLEADLLFVKFINCILQLLPTQCAERK